MKRGALILCLLGFISIPSLNHAATMDQLAGVWQVSSSEVFTVKQLGTETGGLSGTLTVTPTGSSSATYSVSFNNGSTTLNYSGSFSLDAKGKKMTWSIDQSGLDVLKSALKDWAVEWAIDAGYNVDENSMEVEFQSVKYKPIKIDKASNKPVSSVLSVKGTISGYVDGEYVSKKIKYISNVAFNLGPAPPSSAGEDEFKIVPADGAYNQNFGGSVSISGDYAIVGSSLDDDKGSGSGSAYIFQQSGSTWVHAAKLTANDETTQDYFGGSVAISGDYAIVGSAFDDDKGSGSGSAYIFQRSGSAWVQVAKLTANDGATEDHFGGSVSISGEYAIVGSSNDGDKGSYAGSAYIFQRSGSAWVQVAKLTANDGATEDHFGESVSISGDYAIVGSMYNDDLGGGSGSAYIFQRSGSAWVQVAKLTANDGAMGDGFGSSVSISGDQVIVGAVGFDDKTLPYSGSAYIFQRFGSSWIQVAKLTASDGIAGDKFGVSVAISGDYSIVGAYNDDEQSMMDSGSVYIFRRSGSTWIQTAKLTANGGSAEDLFGSAVAISDSHAIVGAPSRLGTHVGAGYLFGINNYGLLFHRSFKLERLYREG
jgi:hypothetical protein